MSAVKLTATYRNPGLMTGPLLGEALKSLYDGGVPGTAVLKVVHFQAGGWELSATWDLDPEDKPKDQEIIQTLPFNIYASPAPGLDEESIGTATARIIQRQSQEFRKLKDHPQA